MPQAENQWVLTLELKWWNWCDEKIKRNAVFFETPLDGTSERNLLAIVND